MTEEVKFPHTDKDGYPLGADCFVKVHGPGLTRNFSNIFRGLVVRISEDKKGPVVFVREWKGGKFLSGERAARPDFCQVRRAPKVLREKQQDSAKRTVGVRRKGRKKNGRK